jgi:hypothetical protein
MMILLVGNAILKAPLKSISKAFGVGEYSPGFAGDERSVRRTVTGVRLRERSLGG